MLKIGITLGDPAGVGPEILVKSFSYIKTLKAQFLIFGDSNLIERLAQNFKIPIPENIYIENLSKLKFQFGNPTQETFLATIKYLEEAIKKIKEGEVKALVNIPINKEAFSIANLPFRGHTEFLAQKLETPHWAMSFYGKKLKLSLVTTHIPLKEVPLSLNSEKILKIAELSYNFLKKLKKTQDVKIALCSLNPHGGEGGLLGEEEETILKPLIVKAQNQGIPLFGPYPADSLFYWLLKGRFDYVIALYHDQGLIPFKMLHFRDGVNLTLGLPIPRTSPVHGTAYDIAGKGKADPQSFQSAVKLALKLAKIW